MTQFEKAQYPIYSDGSKYSAIVKTDEGHVYEGQLTIATMAFVHDVFAGPNIELDLTDAEEVDHLYAEQEALAKRAADMRAWRDDGEI